MSNQAVARQIHISDWQGYMSVDDFLHRFADAYIAAPQWAKSLIGGAYAKVPRPWRFGRRYGEFRAIFEQPVSADYVRSRLSQTLTCALTQVPAFEAYRALAAQAQLDPFAVLSQLPVMSKELIKQGGDRYLSASGSRSARQRMFTGGSTSVPMGFYLHRGVTRAKEWAAIQTLNTWTGVDGDGVVLAMRGRSVRGAGKNGGRLGMYEPIKKHLILSCDHLEPQHMHRYVQALEQWRPRFVHAFPSALYPLLVWLKAQGRASLLADVKGVLLTSESVFEHHLAEFRSFFDCPVIVQYGHSERLLFAHTLANDARYHFWPHYGHMELLDVDGLPVTRAGQVGELVGTSFDNLVMPFVRYRTGDYAVLAQGPATGWEGFPVCERIEGRVQEFVVCSDHRLVSITTLGAAHFEDLERCLRIQFEQFVPGQLILRVVPLQPLGDQVHARLSAAVEHKTQGGCKVLVQEVSSIPVTERGKQRLLIQHLTMEPFLGARLVAGEGAAADS